MSTNITANQNLSKQRPIRILVCEDDLLQKKMFEIALKTFNCDVIFAKNGQEGIVLFNQNEFDIIFLDIEMPVMNGFDALQVLRKEQNAKQPIIALTGHFDEDTVRSCLAKGFDQVILKPIKKEVISRVLQSFNALNHDNKPLNTEELLETKRPKVSLQKLTELSGGDQGFIQEMIEIFYRQTDNLETELQVLMESEDWLSLGKRAHALKSSFGIFGLDIESLSEIERLASTQKQPNNLQPHIDKVIDDVTKGRLTLKKLVP